MIVLNAGAKKYRAKDMGLRLVKQFYATVGNTTIKLQGTSC